MNVTASDSGIEMADTSVDRIDIRNTRMTSTANRSPRPPSVASPWMESSMKGAWSKTTAVVIVRSSSMSATSGAASAPPIAWDTSTVLASGVLVTARPSEGEPSSREYDVASTGSSRTDATCPSSTGPAGSAGSSSPVVASGVVAAPPVAAPLPPAPPPGRTGSCLSWSTMSTGLPSWTDHARPPAVISPAGMTTPLSCSTVVRSSAVRPAAASSAWSGRMRTSVSLCPVTATERTPSTSSSAGTTTSSTVVARALGLLSPDTAIWTTGTSSTEPVVTCGSTPSGRACCAPATAVWSRWVADSMSVP